MHSGEITVSIVEGDARDCAADVLVLKYAQQPFGVDAFVIGALEALGEDISERLPAPGKHYITISHGVTKAPIILFIGVERLPNFGYRGIRDFANTAMRILAREQPGIRQLAVTLHGVNYGLDEIEAFKSEIAGFVDAINDIKYPAQLEQITIMERDGRRAKRLSVVLQELMSAGEKKVSNHRLMRATLELTEVGDKSDNKPHIFVAIPFSEEMEDVYHYAIQQAVNSAGFLCERADTSAFLGDILQRVKERIATSFLVIGELSGANPNVYLEVGYAWGRGRPTLLIVRNSDELKFDVKGQRCIVYKKIRDLEEGLKRELAELRNSLL